MNLGPGQGCHDELDDQTFFVFNVAADFIFFGFLRRNHNPIA